MQNIYQLLGENIRKQRKKYKLTQEKLAEIANISTNFLGQIERGTKKASLETIQKIASALRIPVPDVFGEQVRAFAIKEDNRFSSYMLTGKLTAVLKDKSFLQDLGKIILKHTKNV